MSGGGAIAMKEYVVAFAGNPNVGKSAWINALSGSSFQVGNWPGVTVEKKEAFVMWKQERYHLIDLPGCYTLYDVRGEERISAAFLQQERVDLIVNVLDATNLSRNLLLTLYLRELQIPMLLIFNFMDEVEKQQIRIDISRLSARLQLPILPCSALRRRDAALVWEKLAQCCKQETAAYVPLLVKKDALLYERVLELVEKACPPVLKKEEGRLYRLALELLYQKKEAFVQMESWGVHPETILWYTRGASNEELEQHRYETLSSLLRYVHQDEMQRYRFTQKADALLLHPILAFPCFLALMGCMLLFVFHMSRPWTAWIANVITLFRTYIAEPLFAFFPELLSHVLLDGVLEGVGGILSFVPLMACFYIALGVLEESGYMARAAFLLDRIMRQFHLSGKSFIVLLLGFGCNVTAVYAARTLPEKEKKLTALLVPFMSCQARLPVYTLFAAAFFPGKELLLIASLYGIGILTALLLSCLLAHAHTRKGRERELYALELPPYRLPSWRTVLGRGKQKVKGYVRKACGILLAAMVVLCLLTYSADDKLAHSLAGRGAQAAAFLFEPLGFGDRIECVAALPGAVLAKETIVGYFEALQGDGAVVPASRIDTAAFFSGVYEQTRESVQSMLHLSRKPKAAQLSLAWLWKDEKRQLRAFCFLCYVLLSMPCIMTLAALYHEYGRRLLLASIGLMLLLPYVVTLLIYQLFSLLFF